MTLEQIDVANAGTCQCGCCGGETQEPRALADERKAEPQQPGVLGDEDRDEKTRKAGCQCGDGVAGCACSGGEDCNCGSEQVA